MAEDLVDGALSSKSKITLSGTDIDVDTIDGVEETERIKAQNKAALKQAFVQRAKEVGMHVDPK